MSFPVRVYILVLVLLCIAGSSMSIAGGMVSITPQYIFMNGNQRSVPVSIANMSGEAVEVWFEFRYGYNTNGDSDKVTVLMPDSVGAGEPSAASWIRAYPPRFVLNGQETQTVRLLVEPPPGVGAGEYWARVIVASKAMSGPTISGRPSRSSSIQLIMKNAVPLLYRVGIVDTHVKLLRNPEYKTDAKNLTISLPLRREGNASYWGIVDCSIKNSSGKQVVKDNFKLVVYKDFVFPIKIDRALLPPGDYSVTLTARTERQDIKASNLLTSEPITWSLPIRIQ